MKQTFEIESLNGLKPRELLGMLEDCNSKEVWTIKEVL